WGLAVDRPRRLRRRGDGAIAGRCSTRFGRGAARRAPRGRAWGGAVGPGAAADSTRAVRRGRAHGRAGRCGARSRARVGATAPVAGTDRRRDPASRASNSVVCRQRRGARGAAGARARERSDPEVVKGRQFVETVSGLGGWAVSLRLAALYPSNRLPVYPSLLIPMDDAQSDHLKAYGVTYRVVQAGIKAEWLLNYPGGAVLRPGRA